jgi:DNA repair exonuclease SbcCD ATPase subunit
MDGVISEFKNERKGELDTAYSELLAAQTTLAQNQADLAETKSKIETVDAEIGSLKGQMAPLDVQLAQAQQVLDEIAKKFPGVDFDSLAGKITEMENVLEEKKQSLAAKQAEVEIATQKVAANQNTISRFQKRASDRLTAIGGNAAEGTITAVNNDWGFAVANVGSGIGIKGDSMLIVKRGAQRIAQLQVVSVQPGKTVLDIRQDSLTGVVQPGDRVIFEDTVE